MKRPIFDNKYMNRGLTPVIVIGVLIFAQICLRENVIEVMKTYIRANHQHLVVNYYNEEGHNSEMLMQFRVMERNVNHFSERLIRGLLMQKDGRNESRVLTYLRDVSDRSQALRDNLQRLQQFYYKSQKDVPLPEYEIERRRLVQGLLHLYLSFKSFPLQKSEKLQSELQTLYFEALKSIKTLSEFDQYQVWRHSEASALSAIVQERISSLQNPQDCHGAKKILCQIPEGGFGAYTHYVRECLLRGLATNRTVIMGKKYWRYDEEPFEYFFKPLSNTCLNFLIPRSLPDWSNETDSELMVKYNVEQGYNPGISKNALPASISERLINLFEDPFVWFKGELVKYLLRPNNYLTSVLSSYKKSLNLTVPYVGVHVRRTDKRRDVKEFLKLEKYFEAARHFFDKYEYLNSDTLSQRLVFLSTDDIKVLRELKRIRNKFTDLKIVHDSKSSIATANPVNRYKTRNSFLIFLKDLFTLHQANHLITTLSSNVGRVLNELMPNSKQFSLDEPFTRSLDITYMKFVYQRRPRKALMDHNANDTDKSSLKFKTGDIIFEVPKWKDDIWSDHVGVGVYSGENKIQYEDAKAFPIYKTQLIFNTHDFGLKCDNKTV